MSNIDKLKITLQEILVATNHFAEENYIGLGGFGKVYKGKSEKLGEMAIKRLDRDRGEHDQGDHEFKMEIDLLSVYQHENIVSLLGFCDENDEKILVYKYESKGSLDKHLNSKDLTWIQRLQICIDAARGLKYLHDDVGPQHRILHRDVKSANILLDENWNAKISDFGLSRVGPAHQQSTLLISNACGTLGYIDPEYLTLGTLSQRTDVYAFGVVLFEVLCGRPARVTAYKDERQFLTVLAPKHYKKKTLDKIILSDLEKQIVSTSLSIFSNIAYECLKNEKERPTMKKVMERLQKALDCQLILYSRYNTMSRQISSVVDIKPGMKKSWTVLVQVLEIAHAQIRKSGKTEFKRLVLADAQGTLFTAFIFKSDFQHYASLLIPYKRYYISNAVLSTNDSPYRIGTYVYSWKLTSRTLVEGLVEPTLQKLACPFDFTPFDNMHKYADSDGSKTIVLHCFPSQEHASESKTSTKRDVVIVNEDKKLMLLTLWNKFDEIEGDFLANMIESGPVIYGMRLRVTTFNSLSLSTRIYSGLMIDPPTDEVAKMKEWYNDNKQELQELLKDKSYKNVDLLLPYPKDEDIVSVARVASSLDILKTAWVMGKTSFPKQGRSSWYTVCANCQKNLEADLSWLVTCPSCKLETHVEAKSRLTILIHDDSTSIQATICSPYAEKLMSFTAEQLKEAEENDIDLHNEIAMSVKQHTIVAFIRSYESIFHGHPQTNINIIKAYKLRDVVLSSKLIDLPATPETSNLVVVTQAGSSKGKDQVSSPSTPSKTINRALVSSKKELVQETIPQDIRHAGTSLETKKEVREPGKLTDEHPSKKTKRVSPLNVITNVAFLDSSSRIWRLF